MKDAFEDESTRDQGQAVDSSARYPGAPLWVKVLGVAGLLFILVIVIGHRLGHGPRHHMPFGGSHQQMPPAAGGRRP